MIFVHLRIRWTGLDIHIRRASVPRSLHPQPRLLLPLLLLLTKVPSHHRTLHLEGLVVAAVDGRAVAEQRLGVCVAGHPAADDGVVSAEVHRLAQRAGAGSRGARAHGAGACDLALGRGGAELSAAGAG